MYFVIFLLIGLVPLVLGIFINYNIGRRRFNRRSITGLQQFDSYGKAVVTTFGERVAKFFGTILIIFGLIFTIMILIDSKAILSYRSRVQPQTNSTRK